MQMTHFFDQLRDAVAHVTLESVFGHSISHAIGGFVGSVAAHLIAGALLLAIVSAAGLFAWFELPGRLTARRIRGGSLNRLNILIARFDGDTGQDVKDRIREQISKVFGEVTHRPFDIFFIPITLRDIDSGSEAENIRRIEKKGRRWMRRANANLLLWGRAHAAPGRATIYFLYEEEQRRESERITSASQHRIRRPASKPQGTRVYNFGTSAENFRKDFARAVAFAAANCVRRAFDPDYIEKLKPDIARQIVRKLEPFLNGPSAIPSNLVSEIRAAYVSASEGLGRQGAIDGWSQAIRTLEEDLAAVDRTREQTRWSEISVKLAEILFAAGYELKLTEFLERSIEVYRKLLSTWSREKQPLDWAEYQNGLGVVLGFLADATGNVELAEQVIDVHREALKELSRDSTPPDQWARMQNALGIAMARLGNSRHDVECFQQARDAFNEALSAYAQHGDNDAYMMCKNNLNVTLLELGQLEGDVSYFEQVLDASQKMLASPALSVDQRAGANLTLGNALSHVGDRQLTNDLLEQSVEAYERALDHFSRGRDPSMWARIQRNIGLSLSRIGDRKNGTEYLFKSISAYRNALEEYSSDSMPLKWAEALSELAGVQTCIGERTTKLEYFEQAMQAYYEIFTKITREKDGKLWAAAQNNYGIVLLRLGQTMDSAELVERALEAFNMAAQELTRERSPFNWAAGQRNIGNALTALGEIESHAEYFREAAQAHRNALQVHRREEFPLEWAADQLSLGRALMGLGQHETGVGAFNESFDAHRRALEVLDESGDESLAEMVRSSLVELEAMVPDKRWTDGEGEG